MSSVHAISMTCSMCWTSLCAACLYIIARPDSQFLCMRVYFFVITHRSTVLSILICDLINKYNSLTLALVMTSYFAHMLNSYSGRSLYWRVVFILLSASTCLAFNPLSSSNCVALLKGSVFGNAIVCWPAIFILLTLTGHVHECNSTHNLDLLFEQLGTH